MRILFILISTYLYIFACSGNCVSCHPSLNGESINQKHHLVLKSCISCHTKTPSTMVECGGDCFSCHSQNKLIKSNRIEHQNLASCKECHINKEDLFKSSNMNGTSNLVDLLNNK